MRFTEGDRVRHRGLKFISGVVIRVVRSPEADEASERSYFCKVQLRNGQYYSDRATEWELDLGSPSSSPEEFDHDSEDQIYV
jgi:hypothetical protein